MLRVCLTIVIICMIVLTSSIRIRKCRRKKSEGGCCSGRLAYDNGDYARWVEKGECVDVFCVDGKLLEGKRCPCNEDELPCGCMHNGNFYDRETDIVKQNTEGTCTVTFCSNKAELQSAPIDCDIFNLDACYMEGVRYPPKKDIRKHQTNEDCTITYCGDTGQIESVSVVCEEAINTAACYYQGMRYSKETDIEKQEVEGVCTIIFCSDNGTIEEAKIDCELEMDADACYVEGKRYASNQAILERRGLDGDCYDVLCAKYNELKLSEYYDCIGEDKDEEDDGDGYRDEEEEEEAVV